MDNSCIEYGSNVSGGAFEYAGCGEGLQIASTESLPPCPNFDDAHTKKCWRTIYGQGDTTTA